MYICRLNANILVCQPYWSLLYIEHPSIPTLSRIPSTGHQPWTPINQYLSPEHRALYSRTSQTLDGWVSLPGHHLPWCNRDTCQLEELLSVFWGTSVILVSDK
jgi:hypothetical protein